MGEKTTDHVVGPKDIKNSDSRREELQKYAAVCGMHNCMYNDHDCTTFELELYSESVKRSFRLPITARIVQGLPYARIVQTDPVRIVKQASDRC